MPRTISVTGNGAARARPDVAYIELGVESIHTDVGQAINDNTEHMTSVMGVLRDAGVDDEDVQTVDYSLWVEQVYDREGQLTGETRYHMTNRVRLRLRDLSKTGELLQKALEAGANNVGGISFSASDPVALEREARELAVIDAKTKAEQLAEGLGAQLGPLRQVSDWGGSPVVLEKAMEAGGGYGGGGPVPVSGGQFSVSVQIQVIFEIAE